MSINTDSSNYNSFIGCVSVCGVRGCGEIATKYYDYLDEEFEEMRKKSVWGKYDIYIVGFCDNHSSASTVRKEE